VSWKIQFWYKVYCRSNLISHHC